jgi:hypothetical protein
MGLGFCQGDNDDAPRIDRQDKQRKAPKTVSLLSVRLRSLNERPCAWKHLARLMLVQNILLIRA